MLSHSLRSEVARSPGTSTPKPVKLRAFWLPGFLLNLVLCLIPIVPLLVFFPDRTNASENPEFVLAEELAEAASRRLPAHARIMLVPPPATASPVPVDDIESIMTRVATHMATRLEQPVEILAGGREIRQALRGIMHRQGHDGWRNAVRQLVRNEDHDPGFALIGDAGSEAGKLILRISLISLETGSLLASTSAIELTRPAPRVGTPEQAMADAVESLLNVVPDAPDVRVLPFVLDRSGLSGRPGEYLAQVAARAWTTLASGPDRVMRDARSTRVVMDVSPGPGLNLSGRIWVLDRDRIRLVLNLTEGEALRASHSLDLSTWGLPTEIINALDPARPIPGSGLARVRNALRNVGDGWLQMEMQGGPTPIYRICRSDSPSASENCDLLSFTLISDKDGELMCFAIGDDFSFGMLIPNSYANPLQLQARQPVVLPDMLTLRDGSPNRVVWPAYGPPSATLVGCVVYRSNGALPEEQLSAWSGRVLDAGQVERLSVVLKDSEPVASAFAIVQIVDR